MQRGVQPRTLAAPAASSPMDSGLVVTPAVAVRLPARFACAAAAGSFIQIHSSSSSSSGASSLGAPWVPSSFPGAAGGVAEGARPNIVGGGGTPSSLCCTPHGPAGRTLLVQPARGSGGRPSVIMSPSQSGVLAVGCKGLPHGRRVKQQGLVSYVRGSLLPCHKLFPLASAWPAPSTATVSGLLSGGGGKGFRGILQLGWRLHTCCRLGRDLGVGRGAPSLMHSSDWNKESAEAGVTRNVLDWDTH